MKKILFGVAALGLLGLAGAGVGLKAQDVVETKADAALRDQDGFKTGDTIYVEPKASWSAENAKFAIAFLDSSDTKTTWSPFLTDYTRDGVLQWTIDDSFDYVAVKVIVVRFHSDATACEWGQKWHQTKDLTVGNDGFTSAYNCIWLDDTPSGSANAGFYAYHESSYQLTVGETTKYLTKKWGESKLSGTFDASAGDDVSLLVSSAAEDITPEDRYSNNISSTNKVKVAGSLTFYVGMEADHSTWASGYSGSGATGLQDFCDYLLSSTVSAGVCSDPTGELWNNIKGSWGYCDSAAQAEFNSATITYGSEAAHASVVAEARSRYAYLNSKYGVSLDGATLPSAHNVAALESGNDNSFGIAALSLIAVIVLGAGAFFIARKRRAE